MALDTTVEGAAARRLPAPEAVLLKEAA
jgi:hypothetical protein